MTLQELILRSLLANWEVKFRHVFMESVIRIEIRDNISGFMFQFEVFVNEFQTVSDWGFLFNKAKREFKKVRVF
jgi:hypothetical protein